jgi:type I restriction enzyme R subunit
MPQSESQLEKEFISQLGRLGFEYVEIENEEELIANLKKQLEKFNGTEFSEREFERILNHLQKGSRFEKAKTLRDRFHLKRDDESSFYVRFFNTEQWCKNEYQVTHQISQAGRYLNRYDVTLLVNGLPLVQIELKRRGVELKEAFNQINRYHKHSFAGRVSLFEYVQIFVISNGVNTKYFANNPKQSFAQTFYWTDERNRKITKLADFANAFLEKCHISKIIAKYIVLAEATRTPMVLRPYQYYAVEAIIRRVKESDKNGYIWHTTGSGKTLTSFKASQILTGEFPEIKKVLFVVDRKDLDIQTVKEFNSFSEGSVDGTEDTRALLRQLKNPNVGLIVTTIQKLDRAISRKSYLKQIEYLQNEKVVIIFDECHRSQFGKTHKNIRQFFRRARLFGFTGTPIFARNNVGGVTTADVFDECLHKYIITDAISDNNVLGFAVEYVGRYKQKDPQNVEADIEADIEVPGIDVKEVLESEKRLKKIVEYVLSHYRLKTKHGAFNAIFAVANTKVLRKYYEIFKAENGKLPESKKLKIASIFTYQANEEDANGSGILDEDVFVDRGEAIDKHTRDVLEGYIADYNEMFGVNFSTEKFYEYYKDVQKRVKAREIDLLLVVNMFLTGFDSPTLNTLFVDKNLRWHGLIQAYSRTNRLYNDTKPHGNIVVFRNLKKATDEALELFGDENAKEIVFKEPYEKQKEKFNRQVAELKEIAPGFEDVDGLKSEEEQERFIKAFRELLRLKASLETFSEFSFKDLDIGEQEFYDYQSKYLDLYEQRKGEAEKISILDDIDFSLELVRTDIINYDYIIKLLIGLKETTSQKARQEKTEAILKALDRDIKLRKKKDLIKKFIEENLPEIGRGDEVEEEFERYWSKEQEKFIEQMAKEEKIDKEGLEKIIGEYLYSERMPLGDEIIKLLPQKPKLLERRPIIERVREKLRSFVEIFIDW